MNWGPSTHGVRQGGESIPTLRTNLPTQPPPNPHTQHPTKAHSPQQTLHTAPTKPYIQPPPNPTHTPPPNPQQSPNQSNPLTQLLPPNIHTHTAPQQRTHTGSPRGSSRPGLVDPGNEWCLEMCRKSKEEHREGTHPWHSPHTRYSCICSTHIGLSLPQQPSEIIARLTGTLISLMRKPVQRGK